MSEAPKRIWTGWHPFHGHGVWDVVKRDACPDAYTRTDLFTRALSAAKEAAAELESLHKAGYTRGTKDILDMVKAEDRGAGGGVMRFDLKTPCKNCPFRSDDSGIRFACRERAEEIEESAYRHGFPCHLSADLIEDDEYEQDGYVFGENTQYCAGHIIFEMKSGSGMPWPGIGNDEELADRLAAQMDWDAPVFNDTDEMFAASD